MQCESRTVDARLLVEVVVNVDLHEIGRCHLGPQQLMTFHQKLADFAWNAHCAVVIDQIIPTVMRAEAIDCSEVNTCLTFLVRDLGKVCGRFGVEIHCQCPPCLPSGGPSSHQVCRPRL